MNAHRFEQFEADAAVLKGIAERYPTGSKEHGTIRRAAYALAFAVMTSPEPFAEFIGSSEDDLTEEQQSYLMKIGLK
jgi:hypothetical protein